jgi:Restriction endonuclease BamHI
VGVRLIKWETIIDKPNAAFAKVRERLFSDIKMAIEAVVWPSGASTFTIHAQSGKKRGEGNGVKPIKEAFVTLLKVRGWIPENDYPNVDPRWRPPGPFDAFFTIPSILPFVAEWETGNVSSSHRALNKIVMGMQDECITGGVLVLPTRRLARFLTDRVGNFEEIEPYFRFWKKAVTVGYLAIVAVEHDAESDEVPRIGKGTDGRALL